MRLPPDRVLKDQILDAARAAGVTVIMLQNGWDEGLKDGRRASFAELAQVESAQDHARAP